jgi:hypothetical protein
MRRMAETKFECLVCCEPTQLKIGRVAVTAILRKIAAIELFRCRRYHYYYQQLVWRISSSNAGIRQLGLMNQCTQPVVLIRLPQR